MKPLSPTLPKSTTRARDRQPGILLYAIIYYSILSFNMLYYSILYSPVRHYNPLVAIIYTVIDYNKLSYTLTYDKASLDPVQPPRFGRPSCPTPEHGHGLNGGCGAGLLLGFSKGCLGFRV